MKTMIAVGFLALLSIFSSRGMASQCLSEKSVAQASSLPADRMSALHLPTFRIGSQWSAPFYRYGLYEDRGSSLFLPGIATPEDELCLNCHPPTSADHPVGVIPSGPIPTDLPLSSDGKIICLTCHNSHDGGDTPAGQRMPADQLCLTCHPY